VKVVEMEWKRPPIRECPISTKGRKEEGGLRHGCGTPLSLHLINLKNKA
jgi:hypothetical protein